MTSPPPKSRMKAAKWKKKVNAELRLTANNSRQVWTAGEAEAAANFVGTGRQLAKQLGRTLNAVEAFRYRQRRSSLEPVPPVQAIAPMSA